MAEKVNRLAKHRWLFLLGAILLGLLLCRGWIFQRIFRYEWPSRNGIDIPVLMYHAVAEEPYGVEHLFVRPAELDAQLAYLQEHGYQTITFEDLAHIEDYDKPVLLTFDDGYADNYTELFPLLQKYQAKATVFLITGNVGRPNFLTEAQVKELSDSGFVSIQSHTVTHPELTKCNPVKLVSELTQSRAAIKKLTGKKPIALSYPNGLSNPLTRVATKLTYAYGVRIADLCYTTGQGEHSVPRFTVVRGMTLDDFAARLETN